MIVIIIFQIEKCVKFLFHLHNHNLQNSKTKIFSGNSNNNKIKGNYPYSPMNQKMIIMIILTAIRNSYSSMLDIILVMDIIKKYLLIIIIKVIVREKRLIVGNMKMMGMVVRL